MELLLIEVVDVTAMVLLQGCYHIRFRTLSLIEVNRALLEQNLGIIVKFFISVHY